jgi:transcriptional regulator with PAS, ATPase and Fis domain
MSEENAWIKEFPAAATVCDSEGIILEMNDKSAQSLAKDGGLALTGKNMYDCHPDPARGKLERLMDARKVNVYTIEKKGIKKLIYQSPWYQNGEYAGFVELSFEIPFELPHFIRD